MAPSLSTMLSRCGVICARGVLLPLMAVFLSTFAVPGAAASPEAVDRVDFTTTEVSGVVLCLSTPSVTALVVPASGRVVFVNKLGRDATLRLNGRDVAAVGAYEAVPVVFHTGSASVSMVFSCRLGLVRRYTEVIVTVSRDLAGAGGGIVSPDAGESSVPSPSPGASSIGAEPEPVAVVEASVSVSDRDPRVSALLALLALICVAGVTVAAFRAIVAQRTCQ